MVLLTVAAFSLVSFLAYPLAIQSSITALYLISSSFSVSLGAAVLLQLVFCCKEAQDCHFSTEDPSHNGHHVYGLNWRSRS